MTSDATALGKLANSNASAYQLAVSDTATHVEGGLATIESDLSHIASVTLTSGTVSVSVSKFDADRGALDKIVGGFAISDTAVAIGGTALDALNGDANIKSITISNNAAVAVSVAQLTSDATALGKLANANASPYQLAVSDTAGHIVVGLATIESDLGHIASVTSTSGTVSVAVSQFDADRGALDKIVGGFAISDTAAAIGGALNALNSDAHIGAITISDNAAIAVSVGQLTSDTTALGKLANANASPYQLAVTDTASNVEGGLATIESDLSHIGSLTLSSGTVSVSVFQFFADQGALDKILGGFAISDTAAFVTAALSTLAADAGHITAITATGGTVTVSTTAFAADKAALDKIVGGFDVSDTAAMVLAALSALTADAGHIAAITATGGTVTVSTTAFAADKAALDKIVGGFDISDTVANVTAALAALTADAGHITAITATGGKVTVSTTEFAADKAALDKIVGGFDVSDTVANVTAALSALTADAGHITAITATGGKVTVSTTEFAADKAALDKIVGGFDVSDTVANVTAALAALTADAGHITAITATGGKVTVSTTVFAADKAALDKIVGGFDVSDTVANVTAALSALAADAGHITAITATGGKVTVSTTEFAADKAALDKIVGGFDVSDTVVNVTAALSALTADAGHITAITATGGKVTVSTTEFAADKAALDKIVGGFDISDTVANVTAALSALTADAGHVTAITATGGTVTVSTTVFAADKAALDKIVGGFDVSDTVANVTAALSALTADAGHITAITATGGTVTVSTTAFAADKAALDKIVGGFDVSDTAVFVLAALSALTADAGHIAAITATGGKVTVSTTVFAADKAALDKIVGGFDISDTVANVTAALSALTADAGHITAITATGGTVTVSTTAFAPDKAALDKIVGGFDVSDTVANVTAALSALTADAGHIAAITATGGTVTVATTAFAADKAALNKIVGGFDVSDTAAHVTAALSALTADASHIAAISATGGKVTVSTTAFAADKAALDKIVGGFDVSDTAAHVTAALSALTADAGHVTAITATGGTVTVSTTVFAADKAALDKIVGGFDVSDTVANVTAALSALTADAGHIAAITATGGTVTVSTTAFAADKAALDKIDGGFDISDTVANVTAALAALTADAGHITAITATGGKVTVSTTEFAADKAALDKIVGGFDVSDTAAHVTAALTALAADAGHIKAITATGGTVTVSTTAFAADKAALDKIVGGFDVSDTAAHVTGDFAALEADVAKIQSVRFTDAGTPVLSLTASQSTADASLEAKITGSYVLDVANANGTTTTTGHGDNLLIDDVAGDDTLTGGGNNETFIFDATFGHAILTDFHDHISGITHDTLSLPISEFASFAALLHDASQLGTAVLITASNGDKLTLQETTLASVHAASADFKFG